MERLTIGPWTVDPEGNSLTAAGQRVRIEPRMMSLLVLLAERRGEVVSRMELLERAWDGTGADEALTQAISALRRTLGDDAREPRFIETVPKRGYRLLPAVVPRLEVDGRWWMVVAAAGLLVTAGMWLFVRTGGSEPRLGERRYVTSARGRESQPALSPDGRFVAFVAREGGTFDLHVADRGGRMRRLTNDAALEGSPAWSPDGAQVAFVAASEGRCRVDVVMVASLQRRTVAECVAAEAQLAWSPDGRAIAMADRNAQGSFGLSLLELVDRRLRQVLTEPRGIHGDRFPAFSPDGTRIAFVRTTTMGASDIHVLDVGRRMQGAGARGVAPGVRRVTDEGHWMAGLTWPEEERLLVSSNRGGAFGLWEVTLGGTHARWQARGDGVRPSSSAELVAYEEQRFDTDIAVASLDGSDAARSWMPSTRDDREPSVSPDEKSVAFISARNGRPQLWLASGGTARPLTSLQATTVMTPRWSRDGSRIAFAAMTAGRCEIYVCDLRTGEVRRETRGVSPSFGAAALYFSSNEGGRWHVRAREGGRERVVLAGPAGTVRELDDGSLLFNRMDVPGLWRLPPGGQPVLVTDALGPAEWGNWDVSGREVFFVDRKSGRLCALDPDRGVTRMLRTLEVEVDAQGLSVGGGMVYFTVRDARESDIVLVAAR